FHGTPHRWTVGRAVSHGCVRLYEEDIQALYRLVKIGTPVNVLP
ncbi:MAG TPA: L,D-transpeptidase, partial [Prochlorococcaceae cyanobacterium Gl_MAG_24]|nr:L,D-transpeptidase [Prochlorococcaceae cyanobacterium Gl_MAG_24]